MRFISTSLSPPRSILMRILHPPTQTQSRLPVIYIFWDLGGERTRPVRHETHRTEKKKNTGNIFLLCITNLVCSQVAWPCVWYSIFGQKYRSIKACLHLHSSAHQTVLISADTQTYWRRHRSCTPLQPRPLRRANAVVVPILTSRCLGCLLNHYLPKCVPRKAAGPQRLNKDEQL